MAPKSFSFNPGRFTPAVEIVAVDNSDFVDVGDESGSVFLDCAGTTSGSVVLVQDHSQTGTPTCFDNTVLASEIPATDVWVNARLFTNTVTTLRIYDYLVCSCFVSHYKIMEGLRNDAYVADLTSHTCKTCEVCRLGQSAPRLWIDVPGYPGCYKARRCMTKQPTLHSHPGYFVVPNHNTWISCNHTEYFFKFAGTCSDKITDRPPDFDPSGFTADYLLPAEHDLSLRQRLYGF